MINKYSRAFLTDVTHYWVFGCPRAYWYYQFGGSANHLFSMLCFCRISWQTLQPITLCYFCTQGKTLFHIDSGEPLGYLDEATQIFRKIITQGLKFTHIKNKTWFHNQCFFYFTDIPESLKNSLNLKKIQSGKNWLWGIISHGCLAW